MQNFQIEALETIAAPGIWYKIGYAVGVALKAAFYYFTSK